MSLQNIQLYSYYRSSASYRVRIALNLKGIPYEYKAVHLVKNGGEQHQNFYKSLNPSAELPTIVCGDQVLSQSIAICLYLDDMAPEKPLLFSKDPFEKAKILQACEIINSGIQPLQNLRVLQKLVKDFEFSETQKLEWIQHWIGLGLTAFEELIRPNKGPFCFGKSPTAADAFLIPQVFNAHRFNWDLSSCPSIQRVYSQCKDMEPFRLAHPANQPDTPIDPA